MRSLDTYIGRPVEAIVGTDNDWYILLEGDAKIKSTSGKLPSVDANFENRALIFAHVILHSSSTQMVLIQFENGRPMKDAEWRISLDPLDYQIEDFAYAPDPWAPQGFVPLLSLHHEEENEVEEIDDEDVEIIEDKDNGS